MRKTLLLLPIVLILSLYPNVSAKQCYQEILGINESCTVVIFAWNVTSGNIISTGADINITAPDISMFASEAMLGPFNGFFIFTFNGTENVGPYGCVITPHATDSYEPVDCSFYVNRSIENIEQNIIGNVQVTVTGGGSSGGSSAGGSNIITISDQKLDEINSKLDTITSQQQVIVPQLSTIPNLTQTVTNSIDDAKVQVVTLRQEISSAVENYVPLQDRLIGFVFENPLLTIVIIVVSTLAIRSMKRKRKSKERKQARRDKESRFYSDD